jgi:hypothetical protein
MGVGGQHHAQAALPPEKDPVPIVQEAGWAPGPVWTGAENLASTGIRSPDSPARSESLYRLSYPGRPSACHSLKRNIDLLLLWSVTVRLYSLAGATD